MILENNVEILTEYLKDDAKLVASSLNFQELADKSIIITGANGFLGINFLASLIEAISDVSKTKIYVVVHSDPSPILAPFLGNKNISVFKGDLTDEYFLKSLPNSDIIIHAAGSGMPSEFLKNKLSSLKINTVATFELLQKLNIGGRFLFISSSDLYNGLDTGSYSEEQIGTTNTDHPRACYIEGKRTGEVICNLYQEMGIKAYAVRLSLTYGPGMTFDDSRVLPSFIRKALENDRIDLLDLGEASRTFCYVTDAIELMWQVLLNGKSGLYNIGGIDKIKIRDLADMIGKKMNVSVNYPEAIVGIAGAPKNVDININKILSETNKNHFISLQEGLERTISWFRYLKDLR